MAEKKTIAVVGATGSQDSGLVRAIVSDKGGCFAAPVLTRNLNSDKARDLAKRGAEVVAVGIAGEHLTGAQMAAALGQEVRYNDVPPEVYRSLGFPGAEDLGNMFQFKRDFNEDFGARNPDVARALNPSLQTFDMWLAENKDRIPPD